MGQFHGELPVSTGSRRYDKTKGVTRPSASTLGRRVGQKKSPIPKVKRQYTDSQVAKFLEAERIEVVSLVGNRWLMVYAHAWRGQLWLPRSACWDSEACQWSAKEVSELIQESRSCEVVK